MSNCWKTVAFVRTFESMKCPYKHFMVQTCPYVTLKLPIFIWHIGLNNISCICDDLIYGNHTTSLSQIEDWWVHLVQINFGHWQKCWGGKNIYNLLTVLSKRHVLSIMSKSNNLWLLILDTLALWKALGVLMSLNWFNVYHDSLLPIFNIMIVLIKMFWKNI